jgi:hypothetical protein
VTGPLCIPTSIKKKLDISEAVSSTGTSSIEIAQIDVQVTKYKKTYRIAFLFYLIVTNEKKLK